MTPDQVLRAVLEGAVLAALVALLCFAFPRLRASHRSILWWLVGAKLLVGLVPLPGVHIAALPPAKVIAAAPERGHSSFPPKAPQIPLRAEKRSIPVSAIAAGAWLACAALLALAAIPGWLRVRRWVRTGRALDDDGWRAAAERVRRRTGLRRPPRILAVAGLETPLVAGFFRPAVLLPIECLDRLGPDELEMTLAHEMAHVARGDLWLGLVPALARRVFFFHPAAWIAEREYAIAREAACDEIVLGRDGADAFVYGRLLLRFATRKAAPATIPMSRHSMLRRRLLMIESAIRRAPIGRGGWALVAVAALAFVPVRLQARDAGDSRCLDIGSSKDSAYVITNGDDHTVCGDVDEARRADEQRRSGQDVIWFRVGDQDWVVHDPAVVAKARALFATVEEIGERQAEIGVQQSLLGTEQSKIGMEQGDVGMRQAKIALEQATVEMQRAEQERAKDELAQDAERQGRERLEKEIAERDLELARAKQSKQLANTPAQRERLDELNARMDALGRVQEAFGEKQRVLGERMTREVAEAQDALSRLLERAMRDGTASRVE
jgi:beta-lactamase regulating signal transducer with metallopeptidase domain